jgi:Ni,Fe-hydrogenase III small subunit
LELAARIRRVGRITEPAPAPPAGAGAGAGALCGSLQLRHVAAGSCNGCEIEIAAAFGSVYDAERFGARLVASPRHADGVLVTGVVTRNMQTALRRTREAVPEPRVAIAFGDCACDGGVFREAYGVVGPVDAVIPVDVAVPGCPPTPQDLVAALRGLTGR